MVQLSARNGEVAMTVPLWLGGGLAAHLCVSAARALYEVPRVARASGLPTS